MNIAGERGWNVLAPQVNITLYIPYAAGSRVAEHRQKYAFLWNHVNFEDGYIFLEAKSDGAVKTTRILRISRVQNDH